MMARRSVIAGAGHRARRAAIIQNYARSRIAGLLADFKRSTEANEVFSILCFLRFLLKKMMEFFQSGLPRCRLSGVKA